MTREHRSSGEGARSRLPRGRKMEVYCCDPWAVSLPVAPCRARPSRQRRSPRLSSPQGTLIQHLKEHILHGNMTSSDTIFCYTTVSGPGDAKRGAGPGGLPLPLLPTSDGFGSFGAARLWAFLTFWPLPSHVLIARSTRDPRLLVEQLVMGGLSLSSPQPFLSLWPCLPLYLRPPFPVPPPPGPASLWNWGAQYFGLSSLQCRVHWKFSRNRGH